MRKGDTLSSRRKAAVMITLLGEHAAQVLQQFDTEQIEAISVEIARLDMVTSAQREQIITEFHELATAQEYIGEGGVEQARKVLESAFGAEKAEAYMQRITAAMQVVPFEFLKKADPQQLLGFIQDEHPQTIALILAYLPMNQASSLLTKLPQDLRADVAERIACMDQTPPEVIRRVEQVLEKKVSSLISTEMKKTGGPKQLVELLNRVDRATERLIMESLSENNPELAEQVKNMMFVFEDIVGLDDRAIQQILKEVDVKDLGTALKGVSPEVQRKVYDNMSERAVNMLKEDMEFMGPVKMKIVEESQQKIVAVIRRLEESGEIMLSRGEEDMIV